MDADGLEVKWGGWVGSVDWSLGVWNRIPHVFMHMCGMRSRCDINS